MKLHDIADLIDAKLTAKDSVSFQANVRKTMHKRNEEKAARLKGAQLPPVPVFRDHEAAVDIQSTLRSIPIKNAVRHVNEVRDAATDIQSVLRTVDV